MDSDIKPVAQHTRKVPFSLIGKVEKKLQELEGLAQW